MSKDNLSEKRGKFFSKKTSPLFQTNTFTVAYYEDSFPSYSKFIVVWLRFLLSSDFRQFG
jgi:hypothetical protein